MAESIPCQSCLSSENQPHFELKSTGENMTVQFSSDWARPSGAITVSQTLTTGENMTEETVSATDAAAKIMDYSHPLYEAFDDAVKQATKGKGMRHGGEATPFLTQPIFQISKHTGVGGLIFQMVKKAQEACGKDDQEAFERELLGALVYGGAAYLYVKQHGFKKVDK
jgi:hypothetical protein